jgi:hypothetical protein
MFGENMQLYAYIGHRQLSVSLCQPLGNFLMHGMAMLSEKSPFIIAN